MCTTTNHHIVPPPVAEFESKTASEVSVGRSWNLFGARMCHSTGVQRWLRCGVASKQPQPLWPRRTTTVVAFFERTPKLAKSQPRTVYVGRVRSLNVPRRSTDLDTGLHEAE